MAPRRPPISQRLASLAMMPLMLVTFTMLWAMSKIGRSEKALRVLGRQQQSPQLKQRAFRGYQPTARDVFVCTYSKSGTNWAMQIAYQIAHRGRGEFEHIHHVVPWPDAPLPSIVLLSDPTPAERAPTGMRVIKTHLESRYVPYSPVARYIVVVRDPKEVFVSSYFFSSGMLQEAPMVTVDEWFSLFLSEDFQYGSWAEHMAGYWPWRDRANVLLLTYAEMKDDLAGAVRRIAGLMGVELTEAELAQVIERSGFAYMKQIDHKFMPRAPFPFSMMRHPVMIRQGERGRSSELLTPEQQARIDQHMKAELRRRGSDFPYDQIFGAATHPAG